MVRQRLRSTFDMLPCQRMHLLVRRPPLLIDCRERPHLLLLFLAGTDEEWAYIPS